MPPSELIRIAVAAVWIYEGFWCKILGRMPHQEKIVEGVPAMGPASAEFVLMLIGWVECGIGVWVLAGWQAWWAAAMQTVLLVSMNTAGLIWGRRHIHDPAGMVVKNFALLVLAWVAAYRV